MATNPNDVRLTVLMALQEAHDEEACLEEQILSLMYRFADRFTNCRPKINRLNSLLDNPLIEYGSYCWVQTQSHIGAIYRTEVCTEVCVGAIYPNKVVSETGYDKQWQKTKPNLQACRMSQVVLVDIPENLVENDSIVAEDGLSSEITQSLGGSSDTSEGSKNSGSFKDSGRSDEEYSEDGASSKEGGFETP
ncbi:hypothetical protein Tco_0241691 [Tanacetum coccineum]